MSITETCACGGRVDVNDRWASEARKAVAEWRETHRCSVVAVPPGPCNDVLDGLMGAGPNRTPHCHLRAGHAGAHEDGEGVSWSRFEGDA